jgi:hypothetical protein
LDYSKRVQSAPESASQSFDMAVGFAGSAKGSANMAAAKANLAQASVHGVWAYQGSKPFVANGRLYILWRVVVGEPVIFQPTVAAGRIYISTERGSLVCLNSGDPRDDGWLM